ncbi:alanine racemase [Phycisphaera mikurensis]|uniref:Alanine racemase n=1 Tax=Phycisphaera mikurensis (strain NBRC 102666 / KCTC 22515 / FYK2301M01) TaxID=1142394 RepID=I0ICX5_PHYMF|nr:alanine racemase [Phycisphaera mikurensis]MBB6442243.1 alanine racemase [Phycisphaera mikurensis]BAM03113.1 alanine racemase [Phycisphaera mikurensis NBRC 102666]
MAAPPTSNSWLEVDLAAVEANARVLAAAAPAASLCGVVKKDAYGLGGPAVGRALEAAGAGMLAVYEPREALAIAEAGVGLPFLVLHGTLAAGDPWAALAEAGRLEFQAGDGELLDALDAEGRRRGIRLPVHVHADTGMSREGMPGPAAVDAVRGIPARAGLRLAGVMTHLATADSDARRAAGQVAAFDRLLAQMELPEHAVVHLCNSYAAMREPAWHRRMIRPGIGLYGYAEPTLDRGERWETDARLRPVARWVSRIARVLDASAGAPVGYGATESLEKDTRLGLVPVGYADGYPLALSGRGVVRVGGAECRVVGRVSMDQVMVDLSAAPGAGPGAEVEVYGNDPAAPNALPRMAAAAGSHAYELLTRIHPRVERRHAVARPGFGDPPDAG